MYTRALLSSSCLILSLAALPAFSQDKKWDAHMDLEGKYSNDRSIGEAGLFIPLQQDEKALLFADIRGKLDNNDSEEFNIGLGYRKQINADTIVGGYGFWDRRNSSFGNTFDQATLGAEILTEKAELRANVYLPESTEHALSAGGAQASANGGNIQINTLGASTERAMPGVDIEAGYKLASNNNWDIWGYAGGYHFEADGYRDVTGPRLRAEFNVHSLPRLGANSRFTFGVEHQDDDVRGDQTFINARVRIPFGAFTETGATDTRLAGLDKRMTSRIVRDVDIVGGYVAPTVIESETAQATLADGTQVSTYTVVDANDVIATEVTNAGASSLVVLDGSAGTIQSAGSVTLQTGQTLMGGGSQISVTGVTSGDTFALTLPGSRATVENTGGADNIVLADDSTLQGFNVLGGSNGIVANTAGANSTLTDLTVSDTTGSTIALVTTSGLNLSNLTLNNAGVVAGLLLNNATSITASNITVSSAQDRGVYMTSSTLTLSNSQINNSANDGVLVDFSTVQMDNTVINGTSAHALRVTNSILSGSGNTITGTIGGSTCHDGGGNAGSIAFDDILGGGAGTCP